MDPPKVIPKSRLSSDGRAVGNFNYIDVFVGTLSILNNTILARRSKRQLLTLLHRCNHVGRLLHVGAAMHSDGYSVSIHVFHQVRLSCAY